MIDSETLAIRWGFITNPFRTPVAEKEPNQSSFFVPPPYFTEILGDVKRPSSSFVFGYRGDGKSSLRLAVQKALAVAEKRYAIVEYTTFADASSGDVSATTLQTHLDAMISILMDTLLTELEASSDPLNLLEPNDLSLLQWFLLRYAPGHDWKRAESRLIAILARRGNSQEIKRLGLRGIRHIRSYLRQKRDELERRPATSKGTVSDIALLILTLIAPDLPGSVDLRKKSSEAIVGELSRLLAKLSFAGIVVLVDRLDEAPRFGTDAKLATDFIRPLATALTLLEADGFAIKFFLPWEVYERIRTDIRTDRLCTRLISWQDEPLRRVLKKRLLAFSSEHVQDIDELVDPALMERFRDAIFYYAAGNPRNLFRLLDSIVIELCEREEEPRLINEAAAVAGIERFVATRSRESDGDAYLSKLRERGTPPGWVLRGI